MRRITIRQGGQISRILSTDGALMRDSMRGDICAVVCSKDFGSPDLLCEQHRRLSTDPATRFFPSWRRTAETDCGPIHDLGSNREIQIVGIATRSAGFACRECGFEIARLQCDRGGLEYLLDAMNVSRWSSIEDGLKYADFDVLADTTGPSLDEAPSCVSRMQHAMRNGRSVITSSKWAVVSALHELMNCARERGVEFRFESTVLSGTPLISTIREGMPYADVSGLRGVATPY
jgi:hypothetical protein